MQNAHNRVSATKGAPVNEDQTAQAIIEAQRNVTETTRPIADIAADLVAMRDTAHHHFSPIDTAAAVKLLVEFAAATASTLAVVGQATDLLRTAGLAESFGAGVVETLKAAEAITKGTGTKPATKPAAKTRKR